jgi:hypothetical protein
MCVCVCVSLSLSLGATPYPDCFCCRQPSTAPPPRLHALQRPHSAAPFFHPAKSGVCRVRVVLACCIAVRTVNQTPGRKRGEEPTKGQGLLSPKKRTHILCVCIESNSCMQCKQTQPYAHTYTHTHTHTLTNTHTRMHKRIQARKNMSSRHKTNQTHIQ